MLLKLSNISKSYETGQAGHPKKVLTGVSLELRQGETLAILGPSGSGKSTLLNIIGALDQADEGDINFNGHTLKTLSEKNLSTFRNKEIGFVFQSHHLLPQCTVLENVLIPILPSKDANFKKECRERAIELIKTVDLWEHKDKLPGTLSGGECQRVAVIRALINKPGLILADEPTGSLDRDNALAITSLLLKLNKEFNTSLIVVTHSNEIGAKMDRAVNLENGQLVSSN
jgi:lipoprotein-releasing system ATP-binding protein